MDICKVGARVTCTGCSQFYSSRDGTYGRGARRPLLLMCGHTLCESCVHSALSSEKDSVVCVVCSGTSVRERKDANIHADFPLNMFVLGALAVRQWTQRTGDALVTFVPPGASVRRLNNVRRVAEAPSTQQATPELCEECVSRPCDWFCQQCELKYCSNCYSKVHKAKALLKHVKVPPPVGKVKLLETQLCHQHKDRPLEFYCKQCDSNICAHCFVDSHRPHDVISLLEKNKDCLETLEEIYEKGSKMLKQLLYTHKKVESVRLATNKTQVESTTSYTRVEQQVVSHFSLLHGLLQRMEQQLLTVLAEGRAQHLDCMRSVSRQLSEHTAEVREALEGARVAMLPSNLGLADINTVQEKLRAVLDLPCYLFTADAGDSNSIEFIVDESFMEKVSSHCRLELHTTVTHTLLKADELPPDYVIDVVDESLPEDVCPPLTSSSRTSSVSALSEEVVTTVPVEQQHQQPPAPGGRVSQFALHERADNVGPNNTHPVINIALDPTNRERAKNILIGTSEAVMVTHVKDPSDFYIQFHSEQKKISSLQLTYKKLATASTVPTEVKLNEIYLVFYKADKNWYRARAVSLIPAVENKSEEQILVQYVDYGNSEKVTLSSLRVAPKSVLHTPFQAIHCGLHGIHPAGGKWSSESVKLFAQMVNNSVVLMIVLKHKADKYEVDLCRMPGGGEDVPSSVQDAMVFLGLAHYFRNVPRQGKQVPINPSAFYNNSGLKHGDIIDVTISHVENPSSFYVQKVDQSYLLMNDMMEKLGEEYAAVGNKRLVYSPYLEMPCAALFSVDKKWYRAKVVGFPGSRLVQVEYVDFGNKEVVSWNKIRKLDEAYLQLPAQAIHCSLNDVIPPPETGNKWTAKASNFLQQRTVSQITRMFVDTAVSEVLKVTLYEVKPNIDICINALMVREGLAKSSGVSSSLVEFHKSMDDVQNVKLKIPVSKPKGRSTGGSRKRPSEPPPAPVDDCADEGDDEETEEEDKGPLKVEVKVLSVVNPSHLYVSIVSQQKAINSMMEEMQEFYHQCPNSNKDWAVADHCAAYLTDKRLWYRASIVDLPEDGKVKVFLKDTGDLAVVETSHLRELSNLFTQLHDGAIRCHLAGIKPAGSTATWSILATEFLTSLVSQDNIFSITKKGDAENGSLPAELFVKEIVEEGPLIPTVEEWRAINSKLVEQGLAFAIRDGSTSSSLTSSSLTGGQQLLKALDKNPAPEGVIVSHWLTTQKSAKSAGPRKSPKKLQTSASVTSQSPSITERPAKPERQSVGKKPDLSESMVVHASGAESDGSDSQEQSSLPPLFDSWLPVVPLPSHEIWVVPTYVDMKCNIYFHDSQQEDTLTVISNGLNSRFSNSKPKPYDSYWSPGQTCVVQYHSDKKWYRGKVISVKEDMSLEVMFVDYGNVETCKASELRKDVCMTHIPAQCHAAKLYGIAPLSEDGLWPLRTLDFIHLTVVEKSCFVKLRLSTSNELLMTSLFGPGNLDLYQLLVNMHYCVLSYATEDADSDASDAVYIEAQESADEDVIIEDEQKVAVRGVVVGSMKTECAASESNEKVVTMDVESSVVDSAAHSVVDSAAHSVVDSAAHSVVDSAAHSVVDSATPSVVDSATRSVVDSAARSVVDSAARSVVDSAARSVVDSAARSVVDSAARSVVDSAARSVVDGAACSVVDSAADKGQDSAPVKDKVSRAEDSPETLPGGVDIAEQDKQGSCIDESREVGKVDQEEVLAPERAVAKENVPSGKSSSSDSSDEEEPQLSRKPHTLMDWYDIITEEEKKKSNVSENESGDEEEERLVYHAMELPELDKFLVEVTAMLSINEVVLHLVKTETTELRMMKIRFEELTRILQVEAPTQQVLHEPSIGQPCCACYSEDDQWYRAMIVDIFDDMQIKIIYVDYGNTETVSADCVHEVKPEWLDLPVQGVQARLWKVVEAPDQDHEALVHRLADVLFKPPVIAAVQAKSPLTVQIMCSDTLEPVYKPLFDDGMLISEHT